MAAIVTKQDFTGEWLVTSQQGMDDLLKSLGVGMIKRKAASGMGFGLNKAKSIITQNGDEFVIDTKGQKEFSNKFVAGTGKDIPLQTAEGEVTGSAEWNGNGSLIVKTKMMKNDVVITRTLLEDGTLEMKIEHGKAVAIRIFTKQ
uniref:Uncharacterized protein n=1 Tax=Mucochytrium quahogii TaxID=96639 RepID=A0A7S2WT75_9STRA|mmetsp:Transcript_6130/g.9577  ORF Transcript_6130/g.9577 Transcript_6130/m.9577 type:complete len:145 (+) Transcript_6130:51-485(+)|eukprot:CAMPEP_0203793494 /NCGR_PEP_ID=MMETSP0100_2-20121128/5896_1 /ASSEMBLY_ACC=CAM_ASM_000210 /TAXON_ID=96639 /ORGANISM=" , Strain NY0313808BC1" /LENGTH=144 /DNA_ID=CAMNT_0050697279 /DNA_START=14 /DNA_END=448 /DNA_ORIENTATION=-